MEICCGKNFKINMYCCKIKIILSLNIWNVRLVSCGFYAALRHPGSPCPTKREVFKDTFILWVWQVHQVLLFVFDWIMILCWIVHFIHVSQFLKIEGHTVLCSTHCGGSLKWRIWMFASDTPECNPLSRYNLANSFINKSLCLVSDCFLYIKCELHYHM